MNYVRFFVGCCVLAVLPHASQAQRYYSDDGQYAADVEHIEQSPSQFHKGGVTFAILFYVHRTSDTTPPNKVSPLRSDQLICATIDGITAEGGEVPAFSYSDPDGVSVIGQNSTAICGNEIGSVRKRLEALDFRIYIVDAHWIYARRTVPAGTGAIDFGPLHYTFTANWNQLSIVEGGARSYFQDGSSLQIRQLWPQGIYDDAAIVATDAKERLLHETGGGVMADGGNILERTTDYAAHANCFFTPTTEFSDGSIVAIEKFNGPHGGVTKQIPPGYQAINFPVVFMMPTADQWIVKAEHFHLTKIVLPSPTP